MWLKDFVKSIKYRYRKKGYQKLTGKGIEVGALHQPAPVPKRCHIQYVDVMSREDAILHFPELDPARIVTVDFVVDIDTQGLFCLEDNSLDFVIFNHVIEHVANPIRSIEELFRVLRPGGMLVISAPDKNFTYDAPRQQTPFTHLRDEYIDGVQVVSDEHYLDFLQAVHPEMLGNSEEQRLKAIAFAKDRRDHVHVWDSTSFRDFLEQSYALLGLNPSCLYETTGEKNHFEYFSVWQK